MGDIQEVENLLKKIKKDKNLELYSALDLIYRCGILKKEVCSVTIGDVEKEKNSYLLDTNHAKVEKRFVKIDGKAYANFKKYFNSIKQSSEINNDLPLFPNYYESNGESYMIDACKKYSEEKIKPQTIRTAGIKSYNETLLTTQTNKKLRYKIVSEKFRLTPRAVEGVVEGTSKGPGKAKPSNKKKRDLGILRQFDELGKSSNLTEIFDLSLEFYDHIEKYNFSDEDKNNLIKMWEDKVSQRTSGKPLSDQSKKNMGNIGIIDIMEIIHKPYPSSEFDKKLIDKEYKKMYDYFFPENK